MEMIIGKTYQNKGTKDVVVCVDHEVSDDHQHYYRIKFVETNNTVLISKRHTNAWEEVVIDSDGLIYKLNKNKETKIKTEKEIQERINQIKKYCESPNSEEQIKMTLEDIYQQQILQLQWVLGQED